ncbi:MAG: hypothetical protein FWH10_08315 [Oscillospiraceae bacterium]|nr:hypothetical protein [Oscillospiraceae bacterium]
MNTKNGSFKIIIIIIVSAVILAGVGFVIYKAANRFANDVSDNGGEGVATAPNVTLFRFYMGRTVEDSEITEIRELLGDIVLDIIKNEDFFPPHNNYDENGEEIDMGDGVTIIFRVLDDGEKTDIFAWLAKKYGITPDHLPQGLGRDIYRQDFAE